MGISRGNITTNIIKKGLVFSIDPANRASTIPSTSTLKTFNTIDLSQSGSIITDATWEASSPSSFDFDGTDGHIQFSVLSFTQNVSEFTISTWVKLNDLTNQYRIFGNREPISPYKGLGAETGSTGANSGKLFFYSMSNNGSYPLVGIIMSNEGITANNWFLLTCRYGNSTQEIFINGSSTTVTSGNKTSNVASTTDTTTANFLIGADSISSSAKLNGNIGPVHIYNRALSASEVLFNYNGLKSRFGL
jgi:hypothetical protein